MLIDRGVSVNLDGYSIDDLDRYWQRQENYYEKLNLDLCDTPTEIIDAISLCFLEDGNFGFNDFRALLHMSGMNSILGYTIVENKHGSDYLLIDVFGDNKYYYFDFWNYSYDNLILAIKDGQSLGMPGYMVPIESMLGYTNYSYDGDFVFGDSAGKSK